MKALKGWNGLTKGLKGALTVQKNWISLRICGNYIPSIQIQSQNHGLFKSEGFLAGWAFTGELALEAAVGAGPAVDAEVPAFRVAPQLLPHALRAGNLEKALPGDGEGAAPHQAQGTPPPDALNLRFRLFLRVCVELWTPYGVVSKFSSHFAQTK